jgi:hypothetical protein
MKARISLGLAALLVSSLAHAAAPAPAYPGAKPDAEVAAMLKKKMNMKADAYRTSDPVSKVADFYRKQGLEEMPGTSNTGAAFSPKGGPMLTIQNPWLDMNTGKMMNDTLVIIPKK